MKYPNGFGSYALTLYLGDLTMNDHSVVSWKVESKDQMLCLSEWASTILMVVLVS